MNNNVSKVAKKIVATVKLLKELLHAFNAQKQILGSSKAEVLMEHVFSVLLIVLLVWKEIIKKYQILILITF